MNIGNSMMNVFGGPIWASGQTASAATPAGASGTGSAAGSAAGGTAGGLAASLLGAAGTGAGTAPAAAGGPLSSLSSELQSWLTALQNSQGGAGDTTAAANAMRYGISHHHGGHHHGASAGNAGAGTPPSGSNPPQGAAIPAATAGTDATALGTLGDRLATQVMQAMQAYGSSAAAQATTGALLTTG